MYVYDRRNGISKTVGFVGGMYLARGYVRERLDEAKVKMEEERVARERYVSSNSVTSIYTDII